MPRLVIAAAAGIVALAAAAALVVWRLGWQPIQVSASPVEDPAAARAALPSTSPLPSPSTAAGAPQPTPPLPPYRDPARLPRRVPESAPWDEVPLTSRYAAFGALAPAVRAAVERAREEMDPCFDLPGALDPRPSPSARGPAAITLHLESRPDRIEVVDAPLVHLGTHSMKLVACCQKVVRGMIIPAEGLEPGLRYRYQLVLVR